MPTRPEPKIKKKAFANNRNYHDDRYHTTAWRKLRMDVIRQEPVCRACKRQEATVVDHIQPVRLGGEFFLHENLQPLCKGCHNSKSGAESRL